MEDRPDRLSFYTKENISKEKLIEIESQIKSIIGTDPDCLRISQLKDNEYSILEDLLSKRRWILNGLFQNTPENIEKLQKVNSHLRWLSQKLFERVNAMADKVTLLCDDPTFDDDYEIKGTLKFSYNEEESVLALQDDAYYSSDFQLMISTIDSFYYSGKECHELLRIRPGRELMDAEMSWNETPILYPEIKVCFAVHDLVCHKLYSLPDLVRLNDFWAEVKFIEQSITEQNGARWKDPHSNLERIKNDG